MVGPTIKPYVCPHPSIRAAVALIFRVLFLPFPERFLLVGRANSQTRCLPSLSDIAAVALLCVVIFSSPQDSSHFGVVQVSVRAAYRVSLGRSCFERMLAKWGGYSECRI